MKRLFDSYVIVNYSAAEGKKTGLSSVWIGVMKRDVRFRLSYETHNPSTRSEAMTLLKTILAELHKRGDRVFLGVDFALGYPQGTAKRLELKGDTPQSALWAFLEHNVVDKPDNSNNRFAVAAKMNRLMTDEAYPFWGCPKNAAQKWLSTLKPDNFGDFESFRHTELAFNALGRAHSQVKSLWQMHGAGVVGGQSMLGIVAIKKLMAGLGEKAKVWPFQTGFGALDQVSVEGMTTLIAEINPALFPGEAHLDEIKDAAQVRLTAEALAELDDKGELSALFAASKSLNEAQTHAALSEEGWILGV